MASTATLRVFGVILALLDLCFSLYIIGLYSKIQYEKYHCYWAHGIRGCDFYIHDTNHNLRTLVGIGAGLFSLVFSIILLVCFLKRKPMLAWTWLLKAVIILGIDTFFLAGWLIHRGRFFHSYWDPEAYDEETYFIHHTSFELVTQFILAIIFSVINSLFTFRTRRQSRALKAAESQI